MVTALFLTGGCSEAVCPPAADRRGDRRHLAPADQPVAVLILYQRPQLGQEGRHRGVVLHVAVVKN